MNKMYRRYTPFGTRFPNLDKASWFYHKYTTIWTRLFIWYKTITAKLNEKAVPYFIPFGTRFPNLDKASQFCHKYTTIWTTLFIWYKTTKSNEYAVS